MPTTGARYVLDTNVAIAFLEAKLDFEAHRRKGLEIFLTSVVVGELFFGAEKSRRRQENTERIQRLAAACPVLVCDLETARHYGRIKRELQEKGRPIPINDVWIAASARQHGLVVATRDGHFDEVEELRVELW